MNDSSVHSRSPITHIERVSALQPKSLVYRISIEKCHRKWERLCVVGVPFCVCDANTAVEILLVWLFGFMRRMQWPQATYTTICWKAAKFERVRNNSTAQQDSQTEFSNDIAFAFILNWFEVVSCVLPKLCHHYDGVEINCEIVNYVGVGSVLHPFLASLLFWQLFSDTFWQLRMCPHSLVTDMKSTDWEWTKWTKTTGG